MEDESGVGVGESLWNAGIAVFYDHSNFVGITKKNYFFFSHYGSTEYKLYFFVNKERRQKRNMGKGKRKKKVSDYRNCLKNNKYRDKIFYLWNLHNSFLWEATSDPFFYLLILENVSNVLCFVLVQGK